MKVNKKPVLSKEQLLIALQKKKQCNARAQAVVVSLLEKDIDARDFTNKLMYINPSHYDDIIDERSILHICGYPLCSQELKNVPAKQYEISTTTNKVYDITDRKKFCGTVCFRSSQYIRSQLLESPLWLRNKEIIQEVKIL